MVLRKNVLTTGEVARICSVAPRTVSKWFDSGQLRGYRIPGSKDRRIPIGQLIRFMRVHGIPLTNLNSGVTRLLIIDDDGPLWDSVRSSLLEDSQYEVLLAKGVFEAGALAQEIKPHVIIVNVSMPEVQPKSFVLRARSLPDFQNACFVGVAENLTNAKAQELLQDGFDGYLNKPFGPRPLIELIERLRESADVDEKPSR